MTYNCIKIRHELSINTLVLGRVSGGAYLDGFLGIAWENIFIGLLGGFVVSFVMFLISFIKNKILERKYPISGEYITTFDDLEEGKQVTTTALAILKQSGKKIRGKTFLGETRTWILEGNLTDSGNLHGVYFAEDPLDNGIGNFFLKIGSNKMMYGLWFGFDSINQIVTSGKYTFVPVIKDYVIKEIEQKHISQILAISNQELGEGYLSCQEVLDMMAQKSDYLCKVAVADKEVYGFCLCKIVKKENIASYLGLEASKLPSFIKTAESVGVLKTIAVKRTFHGRGIGYKLAATADNALIEFNIQAVCSPAWKNGDKINSNGVLTSIGLKPHIEVPEFWKENSIENGYSCPVCGEPPCLCSMVLYVKPI